MTTGFRTALIAVACILSGAAAASADGLTPVETHGTGHIATGSLGTQSSTRTAAVAMLSRIHDLLGARPTVTKVAENDADHSLAMFFTDTHQGRSVTGMSIVSAEAGVEATGTVLYDDTSRFPKTFGPMLKRFGAMKPAAIAGPGGSGAGLAPPEPLITHAFPDGTGSIGIPADWKLVAGGGGTAVAAGPDFTTVSFNNSQGALEPGSPMGNMLLNGTGVLNGRGPQITGLDRNVLLHYTGDPVDAFENVWGQRAKQAHQTKYPHFVVRNVTRTSAHSANLVGTGMFGDGTTPFAFLAYVSVSPPPLAPGGWGMQMTYVIVPQKDVVKETATAMKILSSVKIDWELINKEDAESAKRWQRIFDDNIANQKAQNAIRQQSTDASIARENADSDRRFKEGVAMQHYVLGTSVVSDGIAHSVPIDSNYADALVHANPNMHIVPANELVQGVDY